MVSCQIQVGIYNLLVLSKNNTMMYIASFQLYIALKELFIWNNVEKV